MNKSKQNMFIGLLNLCFLLVYAQRDDYSSFDSLTNFNYEALSSEVGYVLVYL